MEGLYNKYQLSSYPPSDCKVKNQAIYFDNDVQTYLHIFVPARLVDLALNIAKLQIIIFLRILMREQKIKDWVISDLSFIIALQENLI